LSKRLRVRLLAMVGTIYSQQRLKSQCTHVVCVVLEVQLVFETTLVLHKEVTNPWVKKPWGRWNSKGRKESSNAC